VKRLLQFLVVLALTLGMGMGTRTYPQSPPNSGGWSTSTVTATASGTPLKIANNVGGYNASFEIIPSGSPATVSIPIQGCMPNGTCDTAVVTVTSTTAVTQNVVFPKLYTYFLFTPSWTGGTSASIKITSIVSSARLGYPQSFSFDLPSPSVGDSALYEHKLQSPGQIVRVSCSTDQGTASINLDLRQESTPNTTGTSVLGSALVCNSNTAITTTIATPAYSANSPIALLISGTSGTPSVVRVHVAAIITQ